MKSNITKFIINNISYIILFEIIIGIFLSFYFKAYIHTIIISIIGLILAEVQFLTVYENKEIARKKLLLDTNNLLFESNKIILNKLKFLLKNNETKSSFLFAECMTDEGKIIIFDQEEMKAFKSLLLIDKNHFLFDKSYLLNVEKNLNQLIDLINQQPKQQYDKELIEQSRSKIKTTLTNLVTEITIFNNRLI